MSKSPTLYKKKVPVVKFYPLIDFTTVVKNGRCACACACACACVRVCVCACVCVRVRVRVRVGVRVLGVSENCVLLFRIHYNLTIFGYPAVLAF